MATFDDLNRVMEDTLRVDMKKRWTPQEVKFINDKNEFFGTFHGKVDATSASIANAELSNVTMYNEDGEKIVLNDVSKISDKLDEAVLSIAGHDERLAVEEEDITVLSSGLDKIKASVADLTENLDLSANNLDAKINDVKENLIALGGDLEKVSAKATDLETGLDEVKNGTEGLSNRMDAVESQVSILSNSNHYGLKIHPEFAKSYDMQDFAVNSITKTTKVDGILYHGKNAIGCITDVLQRLNNPGGRVLSCLVNTYGVIEDSEIADLVLPGTEYPLISNDGSQTLQDGEHFWYYPMRSNSSGEDAPGGLTNQPFFLSAPGEASGDILLDGNTVGSFYGGMDIDGKLYFGYMDLDLNQNNDLSLFYTKKLPFGTGQRRFHFSKPEENRLLTEYRNTRSESEDGTESQISDKIIIDGENRTVTLWKDYQHLNVMMLSVYAHSSQEVISDAITLYPTDTSICVQINTKLGNFDPGTYEFETSSWGLQVVNGGYLMDCGITRKGEQLVGCDMAIISSFHDDYSWQLSSKIGGILDDCCVCSNVDIFSTEYETSNFFVVSFQDNEIPTLTNLHGVELTANGSATGYDATVGNDTLTDVRINYDYASHIVQVSGTYDGRGWGREYLVVEDSLEHDYFYSNKNVLYHSNTANLTDDTAYTTLDGKPKESYTLSMGESDNINYLLTVKKDDGSLSIRLPETDATGRKLNEFILKTDIRTKKPESSQDPQPIQPIVLKAVNGNEIDQNTEDDNQKFELKFLDDVRFENRGLETISVDADGVSMLRFMQTGLEDGVPVYNIENIGDNSEEIVKVVGEGLNTLSSDTQRKIWIQDPADKNAPNGCYADLSVVKITNDKFKSMVSQDILQTSVLYIVSSDYIDAYGQQLCNLTMPDYEGVAATKPYVDEKTYNVQTEVGSLLSNIWSALSACYKKNGSEPTNYTQDDAVSVVYNLVQKIGAYFQNS